MKVSLLCQFCGNKFEVMPSRAKTRKYCSTPCYQQASLPRLARVRKVWTTETAPSWARGLTKETSPKLAAMAEKLKGHKNPSLGEWNRSHNSENNSRKKGLPLSDETKEKMSRSHKLQWQNPKYRASQLRALMRGLKKRPTKPEQILNNVVTKHFPQFRYNGNLNEGVVLASLIPDFVNVNGKKEIIEVFGDYFHSPEVVGSRWQGSELGKIMAYNSVGYHCLVIWEHELKESTEEDIVRKIETFCEQRG